MPSVTMFDSTKESLADLLRTIRDGKTQLPDFQRGWVWDDEHIRSLLSSVSMSFPIGAVMMLQTGNPEVRLKPRPIEGVTLTPTTEPERLILDGQQRLTSLYQSLFMGQAVLTRDIRDKPIKRWYYIDIQKALDPDADREDAIVGLPEDRVRRNFRGEILLNGDLSTMEKECAAELLPLPLMFDVSGLTTWQMKYLQADPARIQERLTKWNNLLQEVIQRYQQYQIPLIVLRKETPKEAVCQVFEKVNTGGVSLTVFELLTATFAADDFNLREDWAIRDKRLKFRAVTAGVENTDVLQAITLLATQERRRKAVLSGTSADNAPGISCKRKDVLRLELTDYTKWADRVGEGYERTAKFLNSLKIFTARDLPYRTQTVPLAAIFAALGDRSEEDGVRAKLARWYWSGVFGELYGGAVESRFAKDVPDVLAWIDGGSEPSTVSDATFTPNRLFTLRTRNSAAYKGLSALLLRDGGLDFRSGYAIDLQTYFDEKIDIHHIFPQDWCRKQSVDARRCDCVVNKTPIAAKTNRSIGGNAPSVYLPRIQKNAGIDQHRLDTILHTHLIDPHALREDSFEAFFTARFQALVDRIAAAMGKPIAKDAIHDIEISDPVEFEVEAEG